MQSGRIVKVAAAFCLSIGALGVVSFVPQAAEAQGAAPAACPNNPLIGTWKLDPMKSHVTRWGGKIPDRIVIIAPYGKEGITRVLIDEGDPRLSGREEHYSLNFDGKAYPTKGGDPRLMRWTRVDCNTYKTNTLRQLIFNLPDGTVKKYIPDGEIQSQGEVKVSADGKTLTDTHSGTLGDQSSYQDEVLVYDRL